MQETATTYRSHKIVDRTAVQEGHRLSIFNGGEVVAEVILKGDEDPGNIWALVNADYQAEPEVAPERTPRPYANRHSTEHAAWMDSRVMKLIDLPREIRVSLMSEAHEIFKAHKASCPSCTNGIGDECGGVDLWDDYTVTSTAVENVGHYRRERLFGAN